MVTRGLVRTSLLALSLVLALPVVVHAQEYANGEDEECMDCHDDRTLTKEENGREISLFVNYRSYALSVHATEGCTSCHSDIDIDDLPHEDELDKVECDMCHEDEFAEFERSLHGQAVEHGRYLAPTCITCHGKHNMRSRTDERSPTYVMNIPNLCGRCHKEGTRVSELREISQHNVLENYSQSIHGDGLFRRGLTVTAVCTSCHKSHDILPHENRQSSINRANIASTCMQCHAQIERVHVKVIEGQLWEKKPHQLPICVDCHQPHKVRRVFYTESFPDQECLSCHGDPNLTKEDEAGETISLYVDADEVAASAHGGTACFKCHTNVSRSRDPICVDSGPVDCSMCHSEEVDEFTTSEHGRLVAEGDSIAPYCTDCHGTHGTLLKEDQASPTFTRNIPDLCGRCHREGEPAAVVYHGPEHEIVNNYTMSIHGKGLIESGLMVTATCIDCHTAHSEKPATDSTSTVFPANIATTCAQCHLGIYEEFRTSVHSPEVTSTDEELPVCNDCHLSHTIKRVDAGDFRQEILDQCGKCHLDVAETYFDTFHGKVSKLGAAQTAKCYDCHGAHNILRPDDPESTLSRAHVVDTCKQCHPNSNRKFVGYLTHATHHDPAKYPYLHYTYLFMTTLLVSVFAFFGVHTLLWIPRAMKERKRIRQTNNIEPDDE